MAMESHNPAMFQTTRHPSIRPSGNPNVVTVWPQSTPRGAGPAAVVGAAWWRGRRFWK